MPIQFIGMIRTNNASELDGPLAGMTESELDPAFVRDFARAHEAAGFDRVLIGVHSTAPDGWAIAGYAAQHTERLHMLLAHRPGFWAPTQAARAAITHDHFSNGRFSFNIVTGGSDADLARDGDTTTHDERYARTDEWLDIVRQVWTSKTPFDYDGRFYQVKNGFSDIKPVQEPSIPIYFGGASKAALPVAAKHADVAMLWGEPLAAVKERIETVRAAANGRPIQFSVSVRPILGPTRAAAWEKAHAYLEQIVSHRGGQRMAVPAGQAAAVGSQRLLEFAEAGEVHDTCLWTPIAAATGAGGNTTALVGTPDDVAEALLAYYDLGVTSILIRGFRPLEDAIEYGRELLPLVHQEVARRDQQAGR